MATHSSILAWGIPWTEEPGGLQSMRLQRVGHNWSILTGHAAATAAKSIQLCPTLCDPRDGSPPGFPSLGFSRQEHRSGLPFASPMHESEVAHSCLTLRDPMDCSPSGSSIHGIFQARVLEWGASAFSINRAYIYIYHYFSDYFPI